MSVTNCCSQYVSAPGLSTAGGSTGDGEDCKDLPTIFPGERDSVLTDLVPILRRTVRFMWLL
jgi:hypothetical protein